MKNVLEQLEPKKVFHFFEEMTRIPHGSGNTAAAHRLGHGVRPGPGPALPPG